MTFGAPTVRELDLAPLGGAVTLGDTSAFYRTHRTPYGRRWWVIALIVAGYLVLQLVLVAVFLPLAVWDEQLRRTILGAAGAFFGVCGVVYGALIWRNVSRTVRLDRAASANTLEYADREPLGGFAGSMADRPGRQEATDVLRSDRFMLDPDAPPVDFAVATFAASPGVVSRRGGIAEIGLPREVPHIVLENRRARMLRRTGERVRGGQRLSLEGDFDRTFTLYCPAGYERDALYIFTPDLMVLLLDLAADCEVELIGSRLLLYTGRPWRLWRPANFARVIAMVDAIGLKAASQTSRYRDERGGVAPPAGPAHSASPTVAMAGRHLRTRPSLGTLLSVAFPLACAVWGVVSLVAR